jgi:hypothetical protein
MVLWGGNVLLLATLLLLTHYLLSNRTYWATWGQCTSQEWKFVQVWKEEGGTQTTTQTNEPPIWEEHQAYSKHDRVRVKDRIFVATVDVPQGRPYYNVAYRQLQHWLAHEIGHPATSSILFYMAAIQVLVFWTVLCIWMYYGWYDLDSRRTGLHHGLFTMVVANGFVTYILCVEGQESNGGGITSLLSTTGRRRQRLAMLNTQVMG